MQQLAGVEAGGFAPRQGAERSAGLIVIGWVRAWLGDRRLGWLRWGFDAFELVSDQILKRLAHLLEGVLGGGLVWVLVVRLCHHEEWTPR